MTRVQSIPVMFFYVILYSEVGLKFCLYLMLILRKSTMASLSYHAIYHAPIKPRLYHGVHTAPVKFSTIQSLERLGVLIFVRLKWCRVNVESKEHCVNKMPRFINAECLVVHSNINLLISFLWHKIWILCFLSIIIITVLFCFLMYLQFTSAQQNCSADIYFILTAAGHLLRLKCRTVHPHSW